MRKKRYNININFFINRSLINVKRYVFYVLNHKDCNLTFVKKCVFCIFLFNNFAYLSLNSLNFKLLHYLFMLLVQITIIIITKLKNKFLTTFASFAIFLFFLNL